MARGPAHGTLDFDLQYGLHPTEYPEVVLDHVGQAFFARIVEVRGDAQRLANGDA
jgi:hypothetical protein